MELVRGYSPEINTTAVDVCRCGLPTRPPEDATWWRPDQDADPGVRVHAVVRYGDKPELRRVERLENNAGWTERGAMVDFYSDRTPPMIWAGVGHCWANTPHPVVAVRELGDGSWGISA